MRCGGVCCGVGWWGVVWCGVESDGCEVWWGVVWCGVWWVWGVVGCKKVLWGGVEGLEVSWCVNESKTKGKKTTKQ